jgi:hypothetical protein
MCKFGNDGRGFYFFYLKYGYEKHKTYPKKMFMLIHGGLTLGFSLKKETHMKKNDDIKKEKKHMKN